MKLGWYESIRELLPKDGENFPIYLFEMLSQAKDADEKIIALETRVAELTADVAEKSHEIETLKTENAKLLMSQSSENEENEEESDDSSVPSTDELLEKIGGD